MSSKSAPICRQAESLYETWENIAQKIIPDGVSIYSISLPFRRRYRWGTPISKRNHANRSSFTAV